MSAVAQWWAQLQGRERTLLVLGAVAILATLYWLALVEPLSLQEARLVKAVAAERDTQQWLAAQRPQLGGAPAERARERLPNGTSLLAAINESAAANDVAAQLTRVTPAGARSVTLGFSAVPYASFMRWLLALDTRSGATVERIRLERAEAPGVVNVELSLSF